MVRSESPHLADAPALGEPSSRANSESSRRSNSPKHQRNGVPIDKSQRLHLELPVRVYSLSPNTEPEPVREMARTLVLYAHGALLEMDTPVKTGQKLLLVDPRSEAKAACRVTGLEPKKNGSKPAVRVEFTPAAPKFWGVSFPSEDSDPTERKQPRAVRRSSRIKCSQPMSVRSEGPASSFKDVCNTQNISHDGVYFHSRHHGYQKGMRLTITFLGHVDFFAANTTYTGQIVRVDPRPDGRVGVGVKMSGRANAKPATAPAPSIPRKRNAQAHRIGPGLALAPARLYRRLARNSVRVVCWPLYSLAKLWRLTARRVMAVIGRCNTGVKRSINTVGGWRTSAVLCASRLGQTAVSLGKRVATELARVGTEVRELPENCISRPSATLDEAEEL